MLELMANLPRNVLGFTATGHVTGEDYEKVLIPAITAALKEHKKINLLYHLGAGFEGFEAAALWEDTKIGLRNFLAFDKIAVVTHVDWIRHAAKAFGFMMPAQVAVYNNADLPTARGWLTGTKVHETTTA